VDEIVRPAVPRPIVAATLMRPQGGSGVQRHVGTLQEHVGSLGDPLEVVSPFSSRSPLLRPAFAVRLLLQPVSSSAAVWWYRRGHADFLAPPLRACLGSHPDAVVYAQCPVSAEVALRVRGRQPVVMAAHFNVSQADEWADKGEITRGGRLFRGMRELEESVVPRLDGIVHVSDFSRRVLEERIPGAAQVPSVVLPNPVEVPSAPRATYADARELVSVGSLEPRKNHAYLLAILRELHDHGLRPRLTIVGEGPERPRLERLVRRWNLEDQVVLTGYVDDATTLMSQHRIYCHVSRMESFGIAVAEAMAQGLPVVAAPVGAIPELVEPGRTGEFWPLDDAGSAAVTLRGLLEQDLDRMGAAGRARARERYAAASVCADLVAFLRDRRTRAGNGTVASAPAGAAQPGSPACDG
jgi:glycosyltransferase involved in cell wall biosynthesis